MGWAIGSPAPSAALCTTELGVGSPNQDPPLQQAAWQGNEVAKRNDEPMLPGRSIFPGACSEVSEASKRPARGVQQPTPGRPPQV